MRARTTALAQAGDAATATVVEDGFWGTLSFVSFLTLSRIDGRWRIVNKSVAHTGGETPAGGVTAESFARTAACNLAAPSRPGGCPSSGKAWTQAARPLPNDVRPLARGSMSA
jgi:Putative lumazine-binding